MIKVNILKYGTITNSGTFDSQELADAWVNQEIANGSWGMPERWVREEQEDISGALETREIESDVDNSFMEYLLPAQYLIEQEDLGNAPLMETLRIQRNILLTKSDWTQLADSPLSIEYKALWATYRQELRDFPENTEDPSNPEWPDFPL